MHLRLTYYRRIGFDKSNLDKADLGASLEALLRGPVIDVGKVQALCLRFRTQVPVQHRLLVWKLFLRVLPAEIDAWEAIQQSLLLEAQDLLEAIAVLDPTVRVDPEFASSSPVLSPASPLLSSLLAASGIGGSSSNDELDAACALQGLSSAAVLEKMFCLSRRPGADVYGVYSWRIDVVGVFTKVFRGAQHADIFACLRAFLHFREAAVAEQTARLVAAVLADPPLREHLAKHHADPGAFAGQWIASRLAVCLPAQLVPYVWERYLLAEQPDAFLIGCSLEILRKVRAQLLQSTNSAADIEAFLCAEVPLFATPTPRAVFKLIAAVETSLKS